MRRTTTIFPQFLATVALGCVSLGASLPAAAAETQCGLKQYDSIDLVVTPRFVYVPVGIENKRGYMVLDFGSAISRLYTDSVESLGLKTRSSALEAEVGGRKLSRAAKFNSLVVGRAGFGKGAFLVAPGTGGNVEGLPVFGWLGTEAFSMVDVELDLSRRKLNLFSHDHCPGDVVYWAKAWGTAPLLKGELGTMYFPVELEDKKVEATFAPSLPYTMLSTDVTRRLYGFDESSPGIRAQVSPGAGAVDHFRAMQLTAPGMQINNSTILLLPRGDEDCGLATKGRKGGGAGYERCYNVYPMMLGRNVLEKLRLYFATKEQMLYFTLADGTVTEIAPTATATP